MLDVSLKAIVENAIAGLIVSALTLVLHWSFSRARHLTPHNWLRVLGSLPLLSYLGLMTLYYAVQPPLQFYGLSTPSRPWSFDHSAIYNCIFWPVFVVFLCIHIGLIFRMNTFSELAKHFYIVVASPFFMSLGVFSIVAIVASILGWEKWGKSASAKAFLDLFVAPISFGIAPTVLVLPEVRAGINKLEAIVVDFFDPPKRKDS